MDFLKLVAICYIVVINFAGLCAMGVDKRRARKGEWRIKEATLFLLAIIGGSVGSWLGMFLFHHKTRHWYFVVGMPLVLALQIFVVVLICGKMEGRLG